MPNRDYIKAVIDQLRGAEEYASQAADDVRTARTDAATFKAQLTNEEKAHAITRKKLDAALEILDQAARGRDMRTAAKEFLNPTVKAEEKPKKKKKADAAQQPVPAT